jgi:hypothetical protein
LTFLEVPSQQLSIVCSDFAGDSDLRVNTHPTALKAPHIVLEIYEFTRLKCCDWLPWDFKASTLGFYKYYMKPNGPFLYTMKSA